MRLSAVQKFTMLDYPGKVACIAFTPGCNLRCSFCHNPEFVLPERIQKIQDSFISEETFFSFLKKRQSLLEGVVVSGGEPTVWKDLPLFLQKIKAMGFLVKLDTNGNHPAMLRDILKEGLADYVAIDVKTSLSEYQKLVGGTVKKENIAESIDLLKNQSVPYEFRATLIKEHHSKAILDEMKQLLSGSARFFLQTFRPEQTLDAAFMNYHPFTREEMKDLVLFFGETIPEVGIRD